MSDPQEQAAYIIAPHISAISVMALTTTTARIDLSAAGELGSAVNAGKFVNITADGGDVYFFMNSADAGTADPAATSGANRSYLIPNGQERSYILRGGYTWLVARTGSGTGYARSYVSSKPAAELVG